MNATIWKMVIKEQRITIIRIIRPRKKDINEELKWFAQSLGLFSERDKQSSLYRLFVELVKSSRENQPKTSDELAFKLQFTRATAVHHLNKLLELGIITKQQNKYSLRVNNLEVLVDELREDMKRTMDAMKKTARDIDQQLGL